MAIIKAEGFKDYNLVYYTTGHYVRPWVGYSESLWDRLHQAWLVLTGKCDTLKWEDPPIDGTDHHVSFHHQTK